MQLTFLGTAAYEGFPNPFCDGGNCRETRQDFPDYSRLTSAVLVDDDLLIDFGPNIMAGAHKSRVSLFNVKTLLITHSHSDHLYPPNFGFRNKPYNASYESLPVMTVLSNSTVLDKITATNYFDPAKVLTREALPFEKIESNGYEITPLPAVHKVEEGEQCLIYLIEKNGRSFLYASDTGPLEASTLERLSSRIRKPLNFIALDATMGFVEVNEFPFHHSSAEVIETICRMRSLGILNTETKVFAHHFSHSSNHPHRKLEELYSEHGIGVTFDGLKISV